MAMEKTAVYLMPGTLERLHHASKRHGMPQAEIIRQAVEQFLDNDDIPEMRSIGIASSDEITGRTAKAWLRANLAGHRGARSR